MPATVHQNSGIIPIEAKWAAQLLAHEYVQPLRQWCTPQEEMTGELLSESHLDAGQGPLFAARANGLSGLAIHTCQIRIRIMIHNYHLHKESPQMKFKNAQCTIYLTCTHVKVRQTRTGS